MANEQRFPEPMPVVHKVDQWASKHLRDVDQYENVTPLDANGMYTLHQLAGAIYAMGFIDGEMAEHCRNNEQLRRDKDFGGGSDVG